VKDNNGEEVVLKTYSRQNANAGDLSSLIDEAEHMQEVAKCPNVATVLDIFQDDGFFYMVSQANYGGDWETVKDKAKAAGVVCNDAWYQKMFWQAFDGLDHLHRNAIMHCDIKEPNLMLKDTDFANPKVMIIDLGLSEAIFKTPEGISGTPGYIPPETWINLKWFPRGDVFSMGVTCFQMITDTIPNEKKGILGIFTEGCTSMSDVQHKTCSLPAPWPLFEAKIQQGEIRAEAKNMIYKCMNKSMMTRPRVPQIKQEPWWAASVAISRAVRGRASYVTSDGQSLAAAIEAHSPDSKKKKKTTKGKKGGCC